MSLYSVQNIVQYIMLWNKQCSLMHISTEVNSIEFNGVHWQENVYRIAAYDV